MIRRFIGATVNDRTPSLTSMPGIMRSIRVDGHGVAGGIGKALEVELADREVGHLGRQGELGADARPQLEPLAGVVVAARYDHGEGRLHALKRVADADRRARSGRAVGVVDQYRDPGIL